MASGAHVTLRGAFPPGTHVELVKVAGPHVLRPEGGQVVGSKEAKANDDGVTEVRFTTGVSEGDRYIARGLTSTGWIERRLVGKSADDPGPVFQPPVEPTPTRIGLGGPFDPAQRRTKESPPEFEAAPHLGLHQVPKGTVLRSDTPHGSAHPVDLPEPAPYSDQKDVPEKVVQMSDTETGRAAPAEVGPQRQEDVGKGQWQRSATPTGVATLLPKGGAVDAQREKESTDAKERRGAPGRAAADPISHAKPVSGASEKESAKRHEELSRSVTAIADEQRASTDTAEPALARADTSGRDAMGQPADEAVARAAGVDVADSPSEPVNKRSRSRKSTKAK